MICVLESDLVRDWRTFNECVMTAEVQYGQVGVTAVVLMLLTHWSSRFNVSSDSQMKGILYLPAGCLPNKTQGSNNPPTNISQMKSFNLLITILFDQIKIKFNKKKRNSSTWLSHLSLCLEVEKTLSYDDDEMKTTLAMPGRWCDTAGVELRSSSTHFDTKRTFIIWRDLRFLLLIFFKWWKNKKKKTFSKE